MTRTGILIVGATLAALAASTGSAATITVPAGGDALRDAVARAVDGDVLVLEPGIHHGPVELTRPVALEGRPGAVVEGPGKGSVITIAGPGVAVRGVAIRGSGLDLGAMDSAVRVTADGDRAVIEGNRMEDNLFGVYLHGPENALVQDNVIVGRSDLRTAEAGNGVSIWNSPGSRIEGNRISHGRDGIFVTTSRRNVFKANRFEKLRFAVHYMYTNDSEVSENVSLGNDVAWAIMSSRRLVIRDNLSVGDRDHGLMLNAADSSEIAGNVVRDGGDKCVFVYNSNKNRLTGNRFENCPIGIHFTAGSERNTITGNAFVGNRTQVKYVGTRSLDWSVDGRGNYWSDNAAFDLDGDGIADQPYRPNDVMDEVMWTLPLAKLLMNSPAVQVIRWAQANFPALTPGGVFDGAPLMNPPETKAGRTS